METITSDSLRAFSHGFFTRKAGVSKGIYAGLNCGLGSQDHRQAVTENRKMVADFMQVNESNLIGVHQTHSSVALRVMASHEGAAPHADGLVTNTPGLAIFVLTADCQPILFADEEAQVIGAAHAGWKGAVSGIIEATIDEMVNIGAQRERIVSAVGPCISQRAYEVGPEFFDDVIQYDTEYSRFFSGGTGDRLMFDLPSFGLFRLRQAGIKSAEWVGHCTYNDAERFYSYRRSCHQNEPDYGRQISVIRL